MTKRRIRKNEEDIENDDQKDLEKHRRFQTTLN